MLVVNDKISIPLREFHFDFVRSAGPGGQNVNKVNTKAVMKWDITNTTNLDDGIKKRFVDKYHRRIGKDGFLTITSQRFRDRGRNVADCLNKLKELIDTVSMPAKLRKQTRPTLASKKRQRVNKQHQANKKRLRKPPTME